MRTMSALSPLISLVERHWQQFGHQSPLDGLLLARAEAPSGLLHAVYRPSLCVVLQGAKVSILGDRQFNYTAGQCLLAKMAVPVTARIVDASRSKPYVAFSLAFDSVMINELLIAQADTLASMPPVPALQTAEIPETLIDPLQRLLALLDCPDDMSVLAPLILKELIWRLLASPFGEALKQVGLKESYTARIEHATTWIREHFHQVIRVAELAAMSNMSVPSFHRHFKQVTHLTPVQFQKQMRLQEARRLLLSDHEVAKVGYKVGYESPSQFSRDYRRFFGAPPGKDKAIIRSSLIMESVN